MKKGVKLLTSVDHGIFPGYTLVGFDMTKSEVLKQLKKWKSPSYWSIGLEEYDFKDYSDAAGYVFVETVTNKKTKEKYKLFYLFINKPFSFKDDEFITLSHEVLHITQFLLKGLLRLENEIEAQAYLHDHIMRQILQKLREKK